MSWDVKLATGAQSPSTFPLSHASVEAIIATGGEEATIEAVAEERGPFQYLRLDYDLRALGSIFKEPAPHIHVHFDGEPRFPGCHDLGDLPIANFIDFIFRNWRHKEWATWLHESYHGVFAPHHHLRAAIVHAVAADQPHPAARRRRPWADLLKRVFTVDVLVATPVAAASGSPSGSFVP